jgi:hypothetical protein
MTPPAFLDNEFPGISSPLPNPALRAISNGLGIQSLTMIYLADRGLIGPRPSVAINGDPDDEQTSAKDNLRFLLSDNTRPRDIDVIVRQDASLKQEFDDAIAGKRKRFSNPPFFIRKPDGSRGILTRGCTQDYKIRPVRRELRKLLGKSPRARMGKDPIVELWIGITRDEAHRAAPSHMPWIYNRHPLLEIGWSRRDCERWLKKEFGQSFGRSGCIRCPFRSDYEWAVMQRDYPDDFEEACLADEAARHGLPGVEFPAFIHDSLEPLRSIDFSHVFVDGDMFGWGNACGGACGT